MNEMLKRAKNAKQRHEYCFEQAAHVVPFSEMYISVCMYLCMARELRFLLNQLRRDCFSYYLFPSPLKVCVRNCNEVAVLNIVAHRNVSSLLFLSNYIVYFCTICFDIFIQIVYVHIDIVDLMFIYKIHEELLIMVGGK